MMPSPTALTSGFFLPACDRMITGGVLFLLLFTPLAFGAVHPWAFALMEGTIFLLVVVWMLCVLVAPRVAWSEPADDNGQVVSRVARRHKTERSFASRKESKKVIAAWPLVALLCLFASVLLLQLLPLSPPFLRLLSPATYTLYTRSLPGWPAQLPYEDLLVQASGEEIEDQHSPASPWVALPTSGEVERGAPVPFAQGAESGERAGTAPATGASLASQWYPWRPLSIAPSLTVRDALKFLAYAGLLLLTLFYPFAASAKGEEKFFRAVLCAGLVIGVLVAGIGIVQHFNGNGKILWFFVPYDWGGASSRDLQRASGPFINPNHFANYLALILPVAVVGILSVRLFVSPELSRAFRLLCGVVVVVLATAILLSLSRGGWLSTVCALSALLVLLLRVPEEQRPSVLRRSRKTVVRVAVASAALVGALALLVVGPSGRGQVDVRLEQTVMSEDGLAGRAPVWQDSLTMAREFPLFGVGLGAWPELFPRYERPPWWPVFPREAHNDYVELLAETGLVGFSVLTGFFAVAAGILRRGFRRLTPKLLPAFVALVVALGGMALHEWVDFNLQIPANALLFTVWLGIALRMARGGQSALLVRRPSVVGSRVLAGVGVVVASVLCLCAWRQDRVPYPHNRTAPASLAEAREHLFAHAAHSSSHLALFSLVPEHVPLSQRLQILETALWLDPKNPRARDRYAASLFELGREEEGLQAVTQSVAFSPLLSSHPYLNRRLLPWLSGKEQQAIEAGFRQAGGYRGDEAVIGLGVFYDAVGRSAEAGQVYEEAALRSQDVEWRVRYLLYAGLVYARVEPREPAERVLRQAITVAPQDPRGYQYLAAQVLVPDGKVDVAKAVIAEGVRNGADPFPLYFSLGEAARQAHDSREAQIAFTQALAFRPLSFDAHVYLGLAYWQEKNFERAALSLRKAVSLNSTSATAFFYLGRAEEARAQFLEAKNAYARAVALAPDDLGLQQHYEAFLQKVTQK